MCDVWLVRNANHFSKYQPQQELAAFERRRSKGWWKKKLHLISMELKCETHAFLTVLLFYSCIFMWKCIWIRCSISRALKQCRPAACMHVLRHACDRSPLSVSSVFECSCTHKIRAKGTRHPLLNSLDLYFRRAQRQARKKDNDLLSWCDLITFSA